MSRKLLVVFAFVVLAVFVAGCTQIDVNAEVSTPTLVFKTATPGTPKPVATLTVPPEPSNEQLTFEGLKVLNIDGRSVEQAMIATYGSGWYSALIENNGVFMTTESEKNGLISVLYESDGKQNIVIFKSGNAYSYGNKIPGITIRYGSVFHGPSYKITKPDIKKGTIQIFEYWSYKGTQYVRYLKYVINQEWKQNWWLWETKSEKVEAWYQIRQDGNLFYTGTSQPTSP